MAPLKVFSAVGLFVSLRVHSCSKLENKVLLPVSYVKKQTRMSNEQTWITVKGEIITESENLKLLGGTIDSRLNFFEEHINSVCKVM